MQMRMSCAALLGGVVLSCASIAALAGQGPSGSEDARAGRDGAERIDIERVLAGAHLIGVGDQVELIVPLPLDDAGRRIGAVGRQASYKGVCGPDGAVATPERLLAHARRDLERMNNPQRGSVSVTYGESPRFVVTYDSADAVLPLLFLPSFQAAAEYVDSRLDDRVEIRIDLSTDDIDGNVIGSASSVAYIFSYENYRKGLMAADNRQPEEGNFANALPLGTLPVRYDNSPTTTAEGLVVVNMTQVRAIFGESVVAQSNSITIELDNTADWDYFVYLDDQVDSGDLSLVDVAVHEITHGLGFRSQVQELGNNPHNRVSGLDLARFRGPPALVGVSGGAPISAAQFTMFPRWGDNLVFFDTSLYARVGSSNAVEFIELEGGDFSDSGSPLQPSHLAYRGDFVDKLGLMDPILLDSETYGPGYWGPNEFGPLTDMGWKIIRDIDIIGDCNGNGVFDLIDILNGARDADNDRRLDSCELFYGPGDPGGTYIDRLTETIYDADGADMLSQFDPDTGTVLNRRLVTSIDRDFNPSDAGTVRVYSGFIYAPAPDEYAFRVGQENDVKLEIAAETFFFFGDGNISSLISTSLPVFIQLEQGWHAFKLTALINESGPLRLVRESRSLGGWGPVPINNFSGTFFADCNGNGIDDQFDPDSDGDGIPDDCEEPDCDGDGVPDDEELDCDNNGVPDDCEPRGDVNAAFNVGVVGTEDELLEFGTCNSPSGFQFDTEIAIWDSNGDLIANNDDSVVPCNTGLLSRLDLQLPAGEYFIGTTGYNAFFSDGFGVDFSTNGCSDGGAYFLRVGASTVIADVDPGKVTFVRFTVDHGAGCSADINGDGLLNFFDLAAFIGLYNAGDPAADLAAPFGTLNFFDIAAYISAFNAGCP